jgi:tRNA threonylcarbamoyladenosine biosynthesis protein TsaB
MSVTLFMKILSLEFSSSQRSVAVVQAKRPGLPPQVSEVVETGGIPTRPLAMVEAALREAHLEREQIECLTVGLGPGSYTGIRTAIALAQGWQLALGVKLVGLSSAECVAAGAQAEGLKGRVAVVIDAQRGEFYLAGYEISASRRRELEALTLVSADDVLARRRAGARLIGPEATSRFPDFRIVFPRAGVLGRLAIDRSDFVTGERLEPIYLRPTSFVKAASPGIVPGPAC